MGIFPNIPKKEATVTWGCSSVVEPMLCMYEALGSIPGTSMRILSFFSSPRYFMPIPSFSPAEYALLLFHFSLLFPPLLTWKVNMIGATAEGRNKRRRRKKKKAYSTSTNVTNLTSFFTWTTILQYYLREERSKVRREKRKRKKPVCNFFGQNN